MFVSIAGISMEGDDILLAEMNVKVEPKRDEWMTKLPPERKVCSLFFYFSFLFFLLAFTLFFPNKKIIIKPTLLGKQYNIPPFSN